MVILYQICDSFSSRSLFWMKDADRDRSGSESPTPARSSRKHKLADRYAEVEAEMINQVRSICLPPEPRYESSAGHVPFSLVLVLHL